MQTRKLSALVCLSLACHDGSATSEPTPAEPAPVHEPQAQIAELPGIALARAGHRADIVDIVLCPDASAALTLDRNGGVRLWPALDGTRQPLAVPIDDPNALSFARTQAGYLIATLDTIGGAEVYEIREHDGELRLDARFSIPPSDPLFELHVLDGGERLLALGVDHRVRLYDAQGNLLSSIAEHGFVPWQLRHVETDAGVTLVAILAGPTRVQRLELRDDQLKIVGEPFPVEIDRGPNRNDLALTPDGQHIAAFSRRKWRSGEWQLHLHALADARAISGPRPRPEPEPSRGEAISGPRPRPEPEPSRGEATLIEGKSPSESKERPRVHLLDGDRMLLDDGTGLGQIISLAPSASRVPTAIPLPGSSEAARLFTSVERGVRVVPSGDRFIVDRLGEAQHLDLGRERTPMRSAGLSPDGKRVIWAFADGWAIESIDSAAADAKPTIQAHDLPLLFADFVDDDRVVLVSQAGTIELVNPTNGWVLATDTASRNLTEVRLARGESPTLLVRDVASEQDVVLELGTDAITERTRVAAESAFIGPWYPSDTPSAWTSMTWSRAGWWRAPLSERTLEAELAVAIEHDQADIYDLVTTPDGHRVFVAWSRSTMLVRTLPNDVMRVGQLEAKRTIGDAGIARLALSPTGELLAAVSREGEVFVHDALTLERQWARFEGDAIALGWSADGTRLVVAGDVGGAVFDAATGELELERRDFMHVERRENRVPQSQPDSALDLQLSDR